MEDTPTLTKHKPGSIGEVWTLAFPMMISALSNNAMVFLDRIILGNYSLDAMNSGAAAGNAVLPFCFGAWAIAAISEVFVGQFNGAQKYEKVAQPVWQMIWFSLGLVLFFVPAGIFGAPYIIADSFHEHGIPYFKWFMSFGFCFPLTAALTGFFVGRGEVRMVTLVAVIANILNLGLDLLLVFGWSDLIPSMGAEGAAIATAFAEAIQALVLFVFFLRPMYRKKFKTLNWQFNRSLFWDCLRIGFPNAVSHMIEMFAWYMIFVIMGMISKEHVTVLLIGQSLFILFAFMADGLQKGVMALASNAIGEKSLERIPKILKSATLLHVMMLGVLAIPLLCYPDPLIKLFLSQRPVDMPLEEVMQHARIALAWMWVYLIFDDFVWILSGILTAAGDTKFVMWMNSFSVWTFAVLPVYIFVFKMGKEAPMVWQLTAFYGMMSCLFFWGRYKSGKWKTMKITEDI